MSGVSLSKRREKHMAKQSTTKGQNYVRTTAISIRKESMKNTAKRIKHHIVLKDKDTPHD